MTAPQRPLRPSGTGPGGADQDADGPSLGDLVSSASKDFSALLRAEVELAKLEIKDDVRNAIAGGIMFAIAAVFGVFIIFALLVALGEGLVAAHIWRWAAYLIVAGVLALVAGIVALIGLRLVKRIRPPERTIATTKDTVAWAKKPTAVPPNAPAALAHRPTKPSPNAAGSSPGTSALSKVKDTAAVVKDKASDVKDRAGDVAGDVRSRAADATAAAKGKASEVKDKAGDVKDKVVAAARDVTDRGGRHRS